MLLRYCLLIFSLFALVNSEPDPCNPNQDCQTCVLSTLCGWCSTLVVYKDGSPGAHCASNDGSHPFACYGIFSTADCIRGYVCNETLKVCALGQPGEGLPYQDCIAQCSSPSPPPPPAPVPPPTPPAATYLCNDTDYTCFQTTPGRGTSKELCEQLCHAPTPSHPSPPPPPSPPAPTYLCNTTNWECFETTPGHGTSPELCLQECKPQPPSPGPPGPKYLCDFGKYQCLESNATNSTSKEQCEAICVPLYRCDEMSLQCVVAPWPAPGIPLPDCEQGCKPHNVTPSDLIGLWRGLQINNGYVVGEYDVLFENTRMTLAGPSGGLAGVTSYIGPVPRVVLQVKVDTSSISGIPVGAVLSMIFQADGASPVTRFLMLASGGPNQSPPDDFHKALNMTSGFDWTLVGCQPGTNCVFHMPAAQKKPVRVAAQASVDDPCMPYATCDVCLGHQYCGWCSVDVIYRDGTPGKRCAGWNSNGSRNQFDCHGVWHTDDCNDYQCLQPQGQCLKVPLGGGESKEDCEKNCIPAPSPPPGPAPPAPTPPTPPALTYLCNTTDFQCYPTTPGHGESPELCEANCHAPTPIHPSPPPPPTPPAATYLCNETDWQCFETTPGRGTSRELCLQQCVSPPPPPPPLFGTWRGLQIDNEYAYGEWGLTFADTGFSLTLSGNTVAKGVVYGSNKPGQVILQINEGNNQGKRFAAMYTETQGLNVLYRTLVVGSSETDMPTGWDLPWIKGGQFGSEFVFLQVNRL